MKKSIKREWIKALRSGKYKQGIGALNRNKSYCCLGVLCDVLDPDGWADPYFGEGKSHAQSCGDGSLSNKTLEKLKITGNQERKLIEMNDDCVSFAKIAKYIVENL